jgi:preprotein translocase subunit SecE
MASATKETEKPMATDIVQGGGGGEAPRPAKDDGGGFFHIYKPGQGYWTRMGTAAAAALIGALTAHFLYRNLPVWIGAAGVEMEKARTISLGIIAVLAIAYAILVFWLTNKPNNADFLIATDSEMKKVNWTSRKELIGSTKVVIIFMFLIAFLLFAFDIVFGYFFYMIGVLKTPPF